MPDETNDDMTPDFLKGGGQGAREEREKRVAERGGMSAEEAAQRVADAARAKAPEPLPPEPTPIKLPEIPSLVRDAVIAGVGALGGGVVAELADAIQDERQQKEAVNKASKWNEEYKDDKFGDLAYGELRMVLTTGKYKGKPLSAEDLEAARDSRELRFREASSYGVMTGPDGILKTELTKADWTDYPAAIARAAKAAESDAQGILVYVHNSRVRGVVSDAVGATELLVKRDGLSQITDLNNPKNVQKLQELKIADVKAEIGTLEDQIKREVLWNPIRNYAALVDQETSEQKTERLAQEQAKEQRKHELELAEIQAGARTKQTGGVDLTDALKAMAEAQRQQREIGVEDDKILNTAMFSADFLKDHDLPDHVYFMRGFKMIRRDMRTALYLASDVGVFEGLEIGNFLLAYIEDKAKGRELTVAEKQKYTIEGARSYKQLAEGIVPVMVVKKKDGGTFAAIAGNPKASDAKLQAGALISAGFDLKDTFGAFTNDAKAKEALAVWMSIFGANVGKLNSKDATFIKGFLEQVWGKYSGEQLERKKAELVNKKTEMAKKQEGDKSIDADLGQISILKKELGMMNLDHKDLTRDEALVGMNKIAEQIEITLGIDKGRVVLMRELANLLVPGPEMQGYRKLLKTHPVLKTPGEMATRPILEKIFYAGKPKFLSDGLTTMGIKELFDRVARLDSGNLQIQYRSMRDLQDGMDDITLVREGKDSFSGPEANTLREKKVAEMAAALGEGDLPKIRPETIKLIERLSMYKGNGKLVGGNQWGWELMSSIRRLIGF